jgi:hypothetical protein
LIKLEGIFLWKGIKEARGGNCLISWDKVTRPFDLGGHGIPNILTITGLCKCDGFGFRKLLLPNHGVA